MSEVYSQEHLEIQQRLRRDTTSIRSSSCSDSTLEAVDFRRSRYCTSLDTSRLLGSKRKAVTSRRAKCNGGEEFNVWRGHVYVYLASRAAESYVTLDQKRRLPNEAKPRAPSLPISACVRELLTSTTLNATIIPDPVYCLTYLLRALLHK